MKHLTLFLLFLFPTTLYGSPNANWMRDNLSTLGKKKLKHLILPGTHDSGSVDRFLSPYFPWRWLAVTQKLNLKQQLHYGIRAFDLRPAIHGPSQKIMVHHGLVLFRYTFPTLLKEIATFLQTRKELVILSLTHFKNFRSRHYKRFYQLLKRHLKPFIYGPTSAKQLLNSSLSKILGGKSKVILVTNQKPRLERGRSAIAFSHKIWAGRYSNTTNPSFMISDQKRKLKDHLPSSNRLFILSWTLTPQSAFSPGVSTLAKMANSQLDKESRTSSKLFAKANIISVDFCQTSPVVQVAIRLNLSK